MYLAGVRHAYIIRGYPNPFRTPHGLEMELFKLTMKGAKKIARKGCSRRLPVTTSVLKDICRTLAKGLFSPYLDLLLCTACIIAFFGFMRCGEFTTSSLVFCPDRNLSLSDVSFRSVKEAGTYYNMCVIHLKYSKIDQDGDGTDIKLFSNPANPMLCPVIWMRKFLSARLHLGADPRGPLFMLPDLDPLSRQAFISYMRSILEAAGYDNADCYTGHSFRAGSATSASAVNMPDYMLCLLGRWHSDAYKRYILAPMASLQHAQEAISTSSI